MKRLLEELFDRHVPQLAGLYLAALWAVVQFFDWAVETFVLSPHLPSFVFVCGLLCLPTVLILAWRLGDFEPETGVDVAGTRIGVPRLRKRDALGVTLNFGLAGAVLFVTYSGRHLGRATTSVTVVDESGAILEARVPRPEFLKDLLIFNFDNESGDADADWMSYAVTLGLQADLAQDPFILAYGQWNNWYDFQGKLTEKGFEKGTGIPLALKREVASSMSGLAHFLSGSIDNEGDQTTLTTQLYDTKSARLIAEHEFAGPDLFALMDSAAARVRYDLRIPAYQLESDPDLPVAEVTTGSMEALKEASLAFHAGSVRKFDEATESFQKAVAADSTFAWAQWSLAYQHLHAGRREEADAALDLAMRYRYRLPKARQLILQVDKYNDFDEDPDRALRTAEFLVQQYPQNLEARYQMLGILQRRGDREGTVRAAEAVLDLNPSDHDEHLFIGQQLELDGRYDEAIEHYLHYMEDVPEERYGYLYAAGAYRKKGDHEAAAQIYDEAEVAVPEAPHVFIERASHLLDLGAVDAARQYRDRAAGLATTARERSRVAVFDARFFRRLGRYGDAMEAYERRKELIGGEYSPLNEALVLGNSTVLRHAAEAGQGKWAVAELDSLSATMAAPYDVLLASTYLFIYLDMSDMPAAREQLERARSVEEVLGFGTERATIAYGEGRIAESAGDCAAALEHYEYSLQIVRNQVGALLGKARCERVLGRLSDAESTVSTILTEMPAHPMALLELSTIHQAMGRTEDAGTELGKALDIWKDADPDYAPARRARRKLQESE